jgi:hypothetical protein
MSSVHQLEKVMQKRLLLFVENYIIPVTAVIDDVQITPTA